MNAFFPDNVAKRHYRRSLIRLEPIMFSSMEPSAARGGSDALPWPSTGQRTTQHGAEVMTLTTGEARTNPRFWLVRLLSPAGRSGSTFVAELRLLLRASTSTTVYFYEPLNHIRRKPFVAKHRAPKLVRDIFQFNIDEEFKQWLTKKYFFNKRLKKKIMMLSH